MTEAAGPPPSLGRNTAVMAAGTLLSRITGFGRVFALAYTLGAGDLAGTYELANTTPNIVYELVLGGVLSGTLLAVFVGLLESRDEERAWRSISAVVTLATVVLTALALLFFVLAPVLVRLYTLRNTDGGELQVDVAVDLVRLFAPQVLFYGVISLSTAILNARRRFAAPMWTPIINNVVVISVLLAYPAVADARTLAGVRGNTAALLLLGLGTTAGVAANAIAMVPARTVRRRLRPVWAPADPAVRTVLRLSGWTVGFVVANQVALFVVLFLANTDPADVAVYRYAYIIFLLPHGVAAVSIATAVAPEMASRWNLADREGWQDQFGLGFRTVLAVTVPAAAGFVLLARPIVASLLEYGALQTSAAAAIASTLAMFGLALPAFSGWYFCTRAYQSIQDLRSLFYLYLVENAINIAAAAALYPLLGVQGLALAFAIAYWGGLAAALWHLSRRAGGVQSRQVGTSVLRIALATVAMAVVVLAVVAVVGADQGTGAVTRVVAATVAGVTVYLIGARVLGVSEIATLFKVRRRDG